MGILTGKRVWITGASSGIGEALAQAFREEGAELILSARRMSELERVAGRLAIFNSKSGITLQALDVSDTASIPGVVSAVIGKCGGIDILIITPEFLSGLTRQKPRWTWTAGSWK
jgi:NADP-dependent 3-hydroxy acid dehydrogenase YdfG